MAPWSAALACSRGLLEGQEDMDGLLGPGHVAPL